MDSLTQITLGAAVGEAVLGKKIGNRAMIWGAIGGTIPDLDVLANFFTDEITSLAFHRGFMHSFLFAALAPLLLGWLTWKFYQGGIYRRQGFKMFAMILWLALAGLVLFGINMIPIAFGSGIQIYLIVISVVGLALLAWSLWKRYYKSETAIVEATWRDWGWLFFWTIFTHPILDGFTPYGTQWFQPFSDYRVGFNNISVVDPIYTVPFLVCLIIASRLPRGSYRRSFFNWLGIIISSTYMLFTLYNKWQVNKIFEKSLVENNIPYTRYMTSPTIFNNILWQGVAEGDSSYFHGMYSLLDEKEAVLEFTEIPKNRHLIDDHSQDRAIRILKWFSNGYYNVIQREDGKLQLNDLRFGSPLGSFERETDYIFRFVLEQENGELSARQTREGDGFSGEAWNSLWKRAGGIKTGTE